MSDRREQLAARRLRDGALADILDDVADTTARRATGRSKGGMRAGKFVRRQFTYYPDTLQRLAVAARELGVAEAEIARWCMERGLQALEAGERPQVIPAGAVLARPQE